MSDITDRHRRGAKRDRDRRKSLARTVIEGGQRRWRQDEARAANRAERRGVTTFCWRAVFDSELGEHAVAPGRRGVYPSFNDKLQPLRRWLLAHVGRPWAEVYAEARARWDVRTTAGRHLIEDHLKTSIVAHPDPAVWLHTYRHFCLDEDGRLGLTERGRQALFGPLRRRVWSIRREAAFAWAGGRFVIDYGTVQFWTQPRSVWDDKPCRLCTVRALVVGVSYQRCWHGIMGLSQTERLSSSDAAFWAALPERIRAQLRWVPARRRIRSS